MRRARARPRKPVHLYIFAKKSGPEDEPNSELLELMVNMVIRGQVTPVAYNADYLEDCAAQNACLNLSKYILDLAQCIVSAWTLHALKKNLVILPSHAHHFLNTAIAHNQYRKPKSEKLELIAPQLCAPKIPVLAQ